jgi:hypothetical protein
MTTRLRVFGAALVLFAAAVPAVACGSSDSGPEMDCLGVPSAAVGRIEMPAMAANLEVPIAISEAKAVKAIDNYYIAARFTAPGGGPETGVWATSSIDGASAQIVSAEGVSHQFTRWPEAPGINAANQYVNPDSEATPLGMV